jgi:hypothetical protein
MTRHKSRPAATMVAAMFALALSGATASAQTDPMRAVASESGKTIFYTTCEGEDFAECIDYSLDCESEAGAAAPGELSLMISGFEEENGTANTRNIMNSVSGKPFDDVSARFVLTGGKAVDLPVISLSLMSNEMNAAWDLTVELYRAASLFEALDTASSEDVKVELGGESVDLVPQKGDGAKLLALKAACGETAQ